MVKRKFNFVKLSEDDFREFSTNYPQFSFMQSVELGHLKQGLGDQVYYFGVKEKDKLIAATLILEEKSVLWYKSFYAPRGFLIDYNDFELLNYFSLNLKEFVKKRHGFRIIIDPNVIYLLRNSDGEDIGNSKNDILISNLNKLGYKHFGFNLYSEALQMRWEYRLKLDKSYEELKAGYSKSTRKNIDNCYKKGLRVRKGKIEDLPTLSEIFEATGKRKDFSIRSLSYYQKMYKHMHDLMTIYIAYIDPDIYYDSASKNLKEEEENNKKIKEKMSKDMVGNKLKNQLETSNKLIQKYQDEKKKAESFKKTNPKGKDVGVLLSMKSGTEYLTLSSGILAEYKSFTPKYAMYDEHVKDALKDNYEWVDFYGINGCFDKNDKYYGIYEFKKGFNGNVVELVGQFEKTVLSFGKLYNFAKKILKRK